MALELPWRSRNSEATIARLSLVCSWRFSEETAGLPVALQAHSEPAAVRCSFFESRTSWISICVACKVVGEWSTLAAGLAISAREPSPNAQSATALVLCTEQFCFNGCRVPHVLPWLCSTGASRTVVSFLHNSLTFPLQPRERNNQRHGLWRFSATRRAWAQTVAGRNDLQKVTAAWN